MNLFALLTLLPTLVSDIQKYLPVLLSAVQAVETVAKDLGQDKAASAIGVVVDHLTPGKPNSPALS